MKKYFNLFLYSSFLSLILISSFGCKKTLNIPITIEVFTQQLGKDKNEQFPSDFKSLLSPFTSNLCGDSTMFLSTLDEKPGITISRIDYNDKPIKLLFDVSSTLGKEVSSNYKRIERIINDEWSSRHIGVDLSKQNSNVDFSKLSEFEDRIVVFSKFGSDSINVNQHFYRSFGKMIELRKFISDDLCNRINSNKNHSNYAIIYNLAPPPSDNQNDTTQLTPESKNLKPEVKNKKDKKDKANGIKKGNETTSEIKIKHSKIFIKYDFHAKQINWNKINYADKIVLSILPLIDGEIKIQNKELGGDATGFQIQPPSLDASKYYKIIIKAYNGKQEIASGDTTRLQINCH